MMNLVKKHQPFKRYKVTPRGSKKRKEMSSKEEQQEIEFLKVVTEKLQKEESEGDLLANLIKREVENLSRQLRIMCETELHQILLKYKMQVFSKYNYISSTGLSKCVTRKSNFIWLFK